MGGACCGCDSLRDMAGMGCPAPCFPPPGCPPIPCAPPCAPPRIMLSSRRLDRALLSQPRLVLWIESDGLRAVGRT